MKTNRKMILLTVLLIFILSTGCDTLQSGSGEGIQASGVVEINEIVVAPEVGGRIVEVWAREGDQLAQGDPLFRIEDKLLESQLQQAESVLGVAQANYDLVAVGVMDEQQQARMWSRV